MLDFSNSLFVGLFLDVLVFSVKGGEGLSVRWGMGIKYSPVKGTLKRPSQSLLAVTSSLAPSSVMAEVPQKASPGIGCKVGSTHTL